MIEVVEAGDTVALAGPSLRIEFRRLADRWTHAIDVGSVPASRGGSAAVPWLRLADAVEWQTAADDPTHVVSPVYQEVRAESVAVGPVLFAVGFAGPHYFSAALRMTISWHGPNHADRFHCYERAEFDVACRTKGSLETLECHYQTLSKTGYLLSHPDDASGTPSTDWRPSLCWETYACHDYDAVLGSPEDDPGCQVALVADSLGGVHVRVAPRVLAPIGTTRFRYVWSHTDVFRREEAEPLPYFREPKAGSDLWTR